MELRAIFLKCHGLVCLGLKFNNTPTTLCYKLYLTTLQRMSAKLVERFALTELSYIWFSQQLGVHHDGEKLTTMFVLKTKLLASSELEQADNISVKFLENFVRDFFVVLFILIVAVMAHGTYSWFKK